MPLAYSPEVLVQKAREVIQRLGYNSPAADERYGFDYDRPLLNFIEAHDKPLPHWNEIFLSRPTLLFFSYRQSNYPLIAREFHDDRLTPGMVTRNDPPPIQSGMIQVKLDPQGRLIEFTAIPPERQEPAPSTPARRLGDRCSAIGGNRFVHAAAR